MLEWKGGLLAALLLLLLAVPAALAEQTFIYGGSERDWLTEMAVDADGRIAMTGWTESSDGTLLVRSKTGRSGWVLCADGTGDAVWSFCTRLGSHDSISHPVFHGDGTLSVLLEAEPDGGQEIELIRLDEQGGLLARKTLMTAGDGQHIEAACTLPQGVVIWRTDASGSAYVLFDWEGEALGQLEGWTSLEAVSDGHVIRRQDDSFWLFARDAQGSETPLVKLWDLRADSLRAMCVNSLITLADGGAAACGWVLAQKDGEMTYPGFIARWDAQGNVVFDMRTELGELTSLVRTQSGFAALCAPVSFFEPGVSARNWTLLRFGEDGLITGAPVPLGAGKETGIHPAMAVLPDGMLAAVQVIEGASDDAKMTLFPAQ